MYVTPSCTHKSYKITSATAKTTASYRQLFVLITMLLTVLSVQQSTFTMAAPLQQQPIIQEHHLLYNNNPLHPPPAQTNDDDHHYHNHHQTHSQQQTEQVLERLQKRHIIPWHEEYQQIMQSQQINWYNPCGGILQGPIIIKKPRIKKELKKLQNTTVKYFQTMNVTLDKIDIKKMSLWRKKGKQYSFLPKLKLNSSISLRRWHKQIQTYVAVFEYLRRAQLHFDNYKSNVESNYSHELKELMIGARELLCGIERAINNTTTRNGKSTIEALFISRTEMEKKFHFTTDLEHISPLHWNKFKDVRAEYLVDEIDLKFAKSHYYSYIRKLIKILRVHTKTKDAIYLNKKKKRPQGQKMPKPGQQLTKTRHANKNSNKRYLQNT